MALTDEQVFAISAPIFDGGNRHPRAELQLARTIESAATAPLLERIAELERELEEALKDAQRWAHACKGNNKQINVCSWDGDAYEFVGYAMKKEAIDAIADAEIAAMQKGNT